MSPVPAWRLIALRFVYGLIALAMGALTWPAILMHSGSWDGMNGVVRCMLGALTLLALLGIRHPLRMLPLLLWEVAWKTIWLIAVALPAWRSGTMTPDLVERTVEIGMVALVWLVIPWGYVWSHYIRGPVRTAAP